MSRAPFAPPPPLAARGFDRRQAFARTVGWVTEEELASLHEKRVAIAGLGGVGGAHLLALTRLGIGRFRVADFDRFELTNFNRQAGAGMSTLGREKSEVLAEMARDVNPTLELSVFSDGVHEGNLGDFLDGVDLYVDGLDFFAVEARRAVFAACAQRGIPAVTAAPLGMGVALLNFLPGHMSFEEYFDLDGRSEPEQLLRFLIGLAPALLQRGYLVDLSAVDLARHRGPSTPMACELCAGVAATEALKILLGRGRVIAAPRGVQFDAYRNRLVRTWRPGGNRHPLQRLSLAIARRRLSTSTRAAGPSHLTEAEAEAEPEAGTEIESVLALARWAPSGDNVQPWRFEVTGRRRAVLSAHDAGRDGVYDLRGHARALSFGALLETVEIAASGLKLGARLRRLPHAPLAYEVDLVEEPGSRPSRLLEAIPRRTVLRRPMRRRALIAAEKSELEASVAPDFEVEWVEGARRFAMARVNFTNAGLRLSLPEAYAVHRGVIAWRRRFSEDGIPGRSLGVDPVTRRLMEWGMRSWRRVSRLNRAGGTLLPRLEMELLPGVFCAAHFFLLARHRPESLDDFVAAGRAVQRFWLTATSLDLFVQPEMTPLIFRNYATDGVAFSREPWAETSARRIAAELDRMGGSVDRAVFLGRIGAGRAPTSRSVRMPLDRLRARAKS